MNSSTWISNQEKKHLAKIASDIEETLMWGHSPHATKKKDAMTIAQRLLKEKKITDNEALTLTKMINADAQDDLDFAITLMEKLSTQNSTQDGSNISRKESHLQEPRSR